MFSTSNEIPNLDLKRNYFLFFSLIIGDEEGGGDTGQEGANGSYSSEKEVRLYFPPPPPCLEISQIRPKDLLLPGIIWFPETGGCWVWGGRGRPSFLLGISDALSAQTLFSLLNSPL